MKSLYRGTKILWIWMRGFFYALKLLIIPKDILTLLKLGDLLTETKSFQKFLNRAQQDPEARQLIEKRYSLGNLKLENLATFPEETLGKVFFNHITQNGLQTYPYPITRNMTEAVYIRERQREIHDILHAAFGLGIEIKDEARLNAILVAQTCPPISVLIIAGSMIHSLFKTPEQLMTVVDSIFSGYAQGKKSKNVFAFKWEEMMTMPITDVRRILESAN